MQEQKTRNTYSLGCRVYTYQRHTIKSMQTIGERQKPHLQSTTINNRVFQVLLSLFNTLLCSRGSSMCTLVSQSGNMHIPHVTKTCPSNANTSLALVKQKTNLKERTVLQQRLRTPHASGPKPLFTQQPISDLKDDQHAILQPPPAHNLPPGHPHPRAVRHAGFLRRRRHNHRPADREG